MSADTVYVVATDDLDFLEMHEATLYFSAGKKVGLQWRRSDGTVLQHSGWTIGEAINAARDSVRNWERGRRP